MFASDNESWNDVRKLISRILEEGEQLVLTEEVCSILRRTAPTVALSESEVETALGSLKSATLLLEEIRKRIMDGEQRLDKAIDKMRRCRDDEDLEGACKQMLDVLAVEVVAFYREIAESELKGLREYGESVDLSATDRYPLWAQVKQLHYRLKKGYSLQFSDTLRDFLRRAALTVALSETEIEAVLGGEEGTTALLREIRRRILESTRRMTRAIYRMYGLREMGDLAAARQQMHDVLAVEVVPFYRAWAEEELKHLDEFEQSRRQQ